MDLCFTVKLQGTSNRTEVAVVRTRKSCARGKANIPQGVSVAPKEGRQQ